FYGVAFHGFARKEGEANIYIGGGGPPPPEKKGERAPKRPGPPPQGKNSTPPHDARMQGVSPPEVNTHLSATGIHLEQSAEARAFHKEIAGAVAKVFASPWRWLVWALMGFLR